MRRFLTPGLALVTTLAACGGIGTHSQASKQPKSVTVHTTTDKAKSRSVTLGPGGGKVATTGADGTRYELRVPKGALLAKARLTIAPITAITGLPKNGSLSFGVKFSPDGFVFARPSWLYVQPKRKLDVGAGVAIEGDQATLRPIAFDGTHYVLAVAHFSGSGALPPGGLGGFGGRGPFGGGPSSPGSPGSPGTGGGPVNLPPNFPPLGPGGGDPPHPGGDPGNGSLGNGGGTNGGGSLTDGLLPPDLNGEITDWADEAANAQLTGDEDGEKRADAKLDKLKQKIRDRVDQLAAQCINEKDIGKLKDILHWETVGQMLGFDDGPGEADYQEQLIEACARFELKVKGKVMFDAGDIFHIGDSVDMTVPLKMEGAAWSGEQTGDVKPIGYDRGAEVLEFLGQGLGAAMGINVPNNATKNDYIHCTTKHAVGKLGALATNLLSDNDLTVHLSLGKSSDATVSCPKLGSFPFPPLVVDPQNMKDAEVAEATDDGLLLEKWQRPDGGHPLATKRIHQSLSEAGASITIDWNFEIEHAPSKMPTRG